MRPIFLVLTLALALGGCDPQQALGPAGFTAICTALVGPIKYNTYNHKSGRFAGPILGMDLKQRNQIGRRLGCPQYRLSITGKPVDGYNTDGSYSGSSRDQ